MKFLALGMLLGFLISVASVWITVAHILNLKTKKTFEVELEGKSEVNKGIVRIREISKPQQLKKIKLGSYRKTT